MTSARDEIARLAAEDRPAYKAATVRAAILARKTTDQLTVERNGLTLVFDATPVVKGGSIDATIRAFRDGNELKVDPHRVCVNPPILVEDGFTETEVDDRRGKRIVRIPTYREDPWQAYLDWLFDSVETTPNPDGWRTRGTVTTVYAGTGDGGIESHSTTFSSAISGAAFVTNTTGTALWCGTTIGGLDYYVQQLFFGFDTSAIADTDTVSDATFSLWANTGNSSREMVFRGWTFDWSSGGLTTADWRTDTQLQALTELFSYAKTSAIGTTAYTDFTNTGTALASAINVTGSTYIIVSDDLNETPTAPLASSNDVEWRMADYSGTTSDPKLTITHAAGGGASGQPATKRAGGIPWMGAHGAGFSSAARRWIVRTPPAFATNLLRRATDGQY